MATKITISEAVFTLRKMKEEDDQSSFNLYIQKVFPQIEKYVEAQLKTAIKKHDVHEGKYKVADFMDELYIKAFEHIHEIEAGEFFKIWLYRTADKLLEEAITEDEFDDFFFKNIDEFTQAEWDEMEEHYSTDGDGDFVMEEELDDLSYDKNDYQLKDVFIEEEEEKHILDAVDKNIGRAGFNQHVKTILPKLSKLSASILELFSRQKLNHEEIAEIKGITVDQVQAYLDEARKAIKLSLMNRYKI